MRISCTNCDAVYDVEGSLLPAEGRQVKCSQCEQVWLAMPTQEKSEIVEKKPEASIATAEKPLTRKERIRQREERLRLKREQELINIQKAEKAKSAAETPQNSEAEKPIAKPQNIEPANTDAQKPANNVTLKQAFQKSAVSSDEMIVSNAVEQLSQKATNSKLKASSESLSTNEKPNDAANSNESAKTEVPTKKPFLKKRNSGAVTQQNAASIPAAPVADSANKASPSPVETATQSKPNDAGVVMKKDYAQSAANFYNNPIERDPKFIRRETADNKEDVSAKPSTAPKTPELEKKDQVLEPEIQTSHIEKPQGQSKFWLGFGFVICFALLLLAVRLSSDQIATAIPSTAPYFELFNTMFDNGVSQLTYWLTEAKEYVIALLNR